MAVKRSRFNTLSSWPNPTAGQFPDPIAQDRDPSIYDQGAIGQIWVNTVSQTAFINAGVVGGSNIWTTNPGSGGTFTSLDVNPGDITVDAGDINVTVGNVTAGGVGTFGSLSTGNATVGGDLAVTGNETVGGDLTVTGMATFNGGFSITDTGSIVLISTNNAAGAITLEANGGTSETILIESLQGTGNASVGLVSTAGGITLNGGKASANAINLTASNAAGGLTSTVGTGGYSFTAANGIITANSGTGIISISSDAAATVVNIGTGAAVVKTISIGGTGANVIALANTQAAGSLAVGTAMTTGTISIGGTAQTGTITLGSSSGTNSLLIANGSGASAVAIANVQVAGSVSVGAGMTTGTISIGGTGAQTGQVDIAPGTGAQTVTLGNGGTAAKTINIGNGIVGNIISLGNGANSSAQVINIAGGASAANSTVNILSGNGSAGTQTANILTGTRAGALHLGDGAAAHLVTLGSTNGAASTTIQGGTGGIVITPNLGKISIAPATGTAASPTASVTMNNRLGVATFTGFTTAMGSSQAWTITNSNILATSAVFVTVTNLNASTNGAFLTVDGITQAVGSLVISTTNNGAGALGSGDNVLVNFWILS